jgi:Lrp/AsnC family transcriptional regulator of ectoine degradation
MKKFALDSTDIRILSAIQQHGQLSKTKLAEIANISATPCWARLDRLKASGFIRGYHADIALEQIADFTQVIVTISLTHHRKADFDRFETFIRTLDAITDCVATGGGMDYVMETITPDLASFQALMETLLAAELGVDRYMTYIATRRVKSSKPNLAKLAFKGRGQSPRPIGPIGAHKTVCSVFSPPIFSPHSCRDPD